MKAGLTESLPARHLSNGAKHFAVEYEHDETGDVEGRHRRADEEVRVVECAQSWSKTSLLGIVHTERYRRRHGDRNNPDQCNQDHVRPTGAFLLGVADWLRHCNEPTALSDGV